MLEDVFVSVILEKALEATIKQTSKIFKELKGSVTSNNVDIAENLQFHLNEIVTWSNEISFKDLQKAKNTSDVFIELDIFLTPRKLTLSEAEEGKSIQFKKIFENETDNRHFVIIGQPGAGKTTLMKVLCNSIITDDKFYPNKSAFPILIRLRELNKLFKADAKTPLLLKLFDLLGLQFSFPSDIHENVVSSTKERFLINLIEKLKIIIIFDGFDEISNLLLKQAIIEDFRKLCLNVKSSKLVLTSRSSDFNYNIDNSTVFEICPLNEKQIIEFSNKWLKDSQKAEDLLMKIKNSPFSDTTLRPLTLAHLCAIYERSGNIPDKPKTIYRKIVRLLLEEWDEQRSIIRPSKYANFEVDRKSEFLCRVAFEITTELQKTIFNKSELTQIYLRICDDFDLSKKDAQAVVDEIESHTGLLFQSGYQNYEFAHKSIQEFLTAEHIVKLPSINSVKALKAIPNELAIAVAISSLPSEYFFELIMNSLKKQELSDHFINVFVNRLIMEKPDFNQSDEVRIALVYLYSQFRVEKNGQLKLFTTDLPILFEKFVAMILRRSNNTFILKNYTIVDDSNFNENEMIKLVAKISADPHLPRILFAKKEFLDGGQSDLN